MLGISIGCCNILDIFIIIHLILQKMIRKRC
jgi:hypothetical protein